MSIELIHGDCLEEMPKIPDGSIDLILTDPPYGTTACKWDSVIDIDLMWAELKRIIKPNGAIVLTASQPFTTTLIASNMKMFKYCWVWEKTMATGGLLAKKRPLKAHEDIVVFCKGIELYNGQRGKGGAYTRKEGNKNSSIIGDKDGGYITDNSIGGRCARSVIQIPNPNSKSQHPTQKPVALMEYLIKTYTDEGDKVLDFTMGSGTTGEACKQLGRNFIGIEKEEEYYNIATKRIKDTIRRLGFFDNVPTQRVRRKR